MQNLDIIVLSSIVTLLFVVFLYVVYKELSKPEGSYEVSEDNGPRTRMIRKVGSIFDSVPETPKPPKKTRRKDKFFETTE